MAILPFAQRPKVPRLYLILWIILPLICILLAIFQFSLKPQEEIQSLYQKREDILSLDDRGKIDQALKIFKTQSFKDLNLPRSVLFPQEKEINEFLTRERGKPNPFSK
jgi:hypothetical protein